MRKQEWIEKFGGGRTIAYDIEGYKSEECVFKEWDADTSRLNFLNFFDTDGKRHGVDLDNDFWISFVIVFFTKSDRLLLIRYRLSNSFQPMCISRLLNFFIILPMKSSQLTINSKT